VAGLIVLKLPPATVDELAVDEQAVRRLDVDDGARLGRRGVLEERGGVVSHVGAPQSRVK
jgi:hypothetical protein